MIKKIFAFLKSRQFLINFGIAVVALPLFFWIIFAWLSSFTRHDDFVQVPDFKDLKIKQLETFVEDKKVDYVIIDSLWDPKLQKGIVIKQDPEPGAKVKEGRKVYLYVTSVQPPMINMPKLEDLSLRQAMAVCQSYGLIGVAKAIENPCDGCIVKQLYNGKRIEPGTPIKKGSTIVLEYGKGENASTREFAVPDFVGMTFRQARGKMIDLGLEWRVVADPGVKDTLNAIVYSQEPKPGRDRKLIQGAMIDLRVSADKGKISSDNPPDDDNTPE
jgi:eukaryotic-like serine/threonine-protein kinase